jgi:hypothetical protein
VDLTGGVIAAQTGTIQAAFVAERADAGRVRHPDETIAAVRNGEADAVLADKSFLMPIAEEGAELMMLDREEMIGGGVGMGVRESDGELKAAFDAAIQSMKDDGSLNELIDQVGSRSTWSKLIPGGEIRALAGAFAACARSRPSGPPLTRRPAPFSPSAQIPTRWTARWMACYLTTGKHMQLYVFGPWC